VITGEREGGLAIIINCSIKYHILSFINVREILMIKVQANLSLIIGMAYVTPNVQFMFDSIDNIFQGNTSIIIRDDFNAKHHA